MSQPFMVVTAGEVLLASSGWGRGRCSGPDSAQAGPASKSVLAQWPLCRAGESAR